MDLQGTFGLDASLLVALVVAVLAASAWAGRRRFAMLLAAVRRDPRALDRFYVRSMVSSWVLALSVPLLLLFEPGPTPADLGLRWPAGGGVDYLLALLLVALIVYGGLRRRRILLSGRWPEAYRSPITTLLPRTPAQRRLAVGISVTAGVVEEAIFRGLLIAAGAGILGVRVELAAALSLALFAWGHLYQGRAGMLGAGVLGLLFTLLYLISGSILLPVIAHIAQDLVALLLIPPPPNAQQGDGAAPLRGDAAPSRPETGQNP